HAAQVLGGLRVNDKLVVMSLAEVLKKDDDEQARIEALRALQALGSGAKSAAAVVVDALKDKSPTIRRLALNVLGATGGGPKVVLPVLADLLKKDEDPVVRQQALSAMWSQYRTEEALPHYVAALKDKDTMVRRNAASYVGNFGATAKAAIPDLVDLAKNDPDI